jgi:Cu/Ag efflux pump CusA
VVEKLPEANTLAVTEDVENAIDDLAPGLAGVRFDTSVYRPASYLDRAIDNVAVAAVIGAALLALAIVAFFLRWRTALVGIVAIPLSLVAAALVLWAFGTTMNAMILAGLVAALALVVDDAVVSVENVARRLRERGGDDERSTAAVIVEGMLETRGVATYATLIVALALLPVFFLDDLAGAFLPDVAGAFLLALAASMVVALTVTPALAGLLLSRKSVGTESPVAGWLQRGYESTLARVLPRPIGAYAALGAVAVAACLAVPFLSTSLLPTFKEQQLLIRWDGTPGTSLPEMNRVTALASRELATISGVEDVGAHVGRAVGSDLSVNANSAELWVSLDPDADYDSTVAAVEGVIRGYPGMSREVGSFSNDRAETVLDDSLARDVVVRVYGEEQDVLRVQADRVRRTIAGIGGVENAGVDLPAQEPTVEVEVDLATAEAKGIKPGDVRRAAATLLGGLVVGNLFEQQKVFEVVVWGTPETRTSLSSIEQLLVDTPDGRHVRLGDVADVRIAANAAVVQRHAVSRYLDVGATVSGRDRDAVVGDIEERLASMTFPLEYHAEVLEAEGQPVGRLIGIAIAAAVGIFLLLQACFGSWRLATLCFLVTPFAVAGGVLAALVDGRTLNFGSVIALFAVFGLAARNVTALVHRCRRLELEEGEQLGADLVLRAARERFVPVALTALAAGLALLPFVIGGTRAGYELAHSAALVTIGGLVTSTLVGLYAIPVLYLRFARSALADRDAEQAPAAPAEEAPDTGGLLEPMQ